MEYRDDLFVALLAGLPADERADVMNAIDRTTAGKKRQLERASRAEETRVERRRASRRQAMTARASRDPR
jgi:hypothetical protein